MSTTTWARRAGHTPEAPRRRARARARTRGRRLGGGCIATSVGGATATRTRRGSEHRQCGERVANARPHAGPPTKSRSPQKGHDSAHVFCGLRASPMQRGSRGAGRAAECRGGPLAMRGGRRSGRLRRAPPCARGAEGRSVRRDGDAASHPGSLRRRCISRRGPAQRGATSATAARSADRGGRHPPLIRSHPRLRPPERQTDNPD